MKLTNLLVGTNIYSDTSNIEISNITADSREVKKGYLFASLDNGICNGDDYILDAIAKGAIAILCKSNHWGTKFPETIFIVSDNPNLAFAKIVANFYSNQPENICAITGTNGKTSIADFIRQMLCYLGESAASIGTLGLIKNKEEPIPYLNTTPGTITIHKDLQKLAQNGVHYLAIEASSHGIFQHRISGVKIKVAGFTNLTLDHLDYHKTMDSYFAAKKMLFTDILEENGIAVLNADIDVYENLKQACIQRGIEVISYGHSGNEIRLLEEIPDEKGQTLKIKWFGEEKEIFIPLAGDFQAMNALCAMGMAAALCKRPDDILNAISHIRGAKGRLEYIGKTKNGGAVYVDYAHTPDALKNVMEAMKSHTKNKMHILFGCGGDRDATKRPIMGQIAAQMADVVYVTDDNPRTENPENIRKQIMKGCPTAYNIDEREKAIAFAIQQLKDGDVLILAGKGHETGQYIMGKVYPFSDQEVAKKYL